MAKPKNMTAEQEAAWRREKYREAYHKWRAKNPEKRREADRNRYAANAKKRRESQRNWAALNPEKRREYERKSRNKSCNQSAADQFFVMAGAAEQISKITNTNNTNENNTDSK